MTTDVRTRIRARDPDAFAELYDECARSVYNHAFPADRRLQIPGSSTANILIRVDSAGATHRLLEHLEALKTTRRTVRYTLGWKITEDDEKAIARLPETASDRPGGT